MVAGGAVEVEAAAEEVAAEEAAAMPAVLTVVLAAVPAAVHAAPRSSAAAALVARISERLLSVQHGRVHCYPAVASGFARTLHFSRLGHRRRLARVVWPRAPEAEVAAVPCRGSREK